MWFEAAATDPDGDPLTYTWDFGDGPGSALGSETEHEYLEPGTFTAVVTVSDPSGATDSAEIEITVTNPPGNRPPSVEAAGVPLAGSAPLDVLLTAQGTDPDGDALLYAWDPGDGSPVIDGRRARHTYTAPGTYDATVTATDEHGASATATVQIVVGNPPANQAPTVIAAADPLSGKAPLKVKLSAAGFDPDGDALSYVWDFGDGGAAGGPKATHTYQAPGTYTATVTVRDAAGHSASAGVVITVTPKTAATALTGDAAILTVRTATVQQFAERGLKAVVRCGPAARASATVRVTRAAARRLGLASRRLAARTVRCAEGRATAVRVRPSRAVARRLARRSSSLRVVLRLAPAGGKAVTRHVKLR